MRVEKIEVETFIEDKLTEITLECLKKIKSTFFVLHDSFFTITNKDLVVLKCFISKNTTVDITKHLPLIGSNLKEESYGKTAILYASIKNATSQIKNSKDNIREAAKVEAIATPIKYRNEVIGYIGLTTINNEITNTLSIFIESLSLNIERCLERASVKKDLANYMDLINAKSNSDFLNYLSSREQVISQYMLMSYSNNEIANTLCISESTVKTYLKRIYEKCGTNNRIDTTVAIICNNILQKL
jgi:DNA-binding CsgD family transcriptional regulator